MQLDQDIEAALAWQRSHPSPPLRSQPVADARRAYDDGATLLDPSPPTIAHVTEREIPVADGTRPARLYVPEGDLEGAGILLWLHGGGWFQGSLASHDPACRRLAAGSGVRVLALEYRLAPEHPFPAGLEDAEGAARWVVDHAEQLGVDPGRVAIGGDSAGATLALVAGLALARDDQALALQVLCYPPLGPELRTDSRHELGAGYGLSADEMDYCYELYLAPGQNHADARVSPLLTPDLHAAPPTILSVAGFDPLRDEGMALAGLLEGSGVEVELHDETTLTHGFLRLGGISHAAASATQRIAESIGRRLSGDRP